ncbi:hypothetical protein RHGRI_017391 [Rhododendron griersonianum]|uniref:Bulb-type lectin domain-containing protein n=1 Tax=Rhododendron griersonianum TaxID=479676 RepID=A0AAV6JXL3_9ERIC|nr:hypothetical protein RHGRI_017391 [Rhododendron griersonianum]
MVDKYNADMQLHGAEVVEMMKLAVWCLQSDYQRRPSMTVVVLVLEGFVSVEDNLDYNFINAPAIRTKAATGEDVDAIHDGTPLFAVDLSGPRGTFTFASVVDPLLISTASRDRSIFCTSFPLPSFPQIDYGTYLTVTEINAPQLVWSANRDRLVELNATLKFTGNGDLRLEDADGDLVWSTNTGLRLNEFGNLVLFDRNNATVWQSFDHPTDSLLLGQKLVSGRKLIARTSSSDFSQGMFSLSVRNGSLLAYLEANSPVVYYQSMLKVITEKVDVYSFGVVALEILCGRKNLDRSQPEEDMHLLRLFERKGEEGQLLDMVDKYNGDMQLHGAEVAELMKVAVWCLQSDYQRRPSMTVVVQVLEGFVSVQDNLDYNFINVPARRTVAATGENMDAIDDGTPLLASVLSRPSSGGGGGGGYGGDGGGGGGGGDVVVVVEWWWRRHGGGGDVVVAAAALWWWRRGGGGGGGGDVVVVVAAALW